MAVSHLDVVLPAAQRSVLDTAGRVALRPGIGQSEVASRTVLCEDRMAGSTLAEHALAWTHGRVGRWVGVAVYPTSQGWVVATLDVHPARHGRLSLHCMTATALGAFCTSLQDAAQVVLLCDSSHTQEWLAALGPDVPIFAQRSVLQVQLYASMELGIALLPNPTARRDALEAFQVSTRRSALQRALDVVAADLRVLIASGGAQVVLH